MRLRETGVESLGESESGSVRKKRDITILFFSTLTIFTRFQGLENKKDYDDNNHAAVRQLLCRVV